MSLFEDRLETMISSQIVARGIQDPRVLEAFRRVPRHLFVPKQLFQEAYEDYPLSIGHGQTISQPYIVALMTELLDVMPHHTVLEIGTGSGYQAAILSLLARRVVTIERIEALYNEAKERLFSYSNVLCVFGDGYEGYPPEAPYDRIILTAAPPEIPSLLLSQLTVGGKLVAPVGTVFQTLQRWVKTTSKKWSYEDICEVIFVPMLRSFQKTSS